MEWSPLHISTSDVRQFHAIWLPPQNGRKQRILYALNRGRKIAVLELQRGADGAFRLAIPSELATGNELPDTAANPLFVWVLDEERNRMVLRLYATVQAEAGRWPLRYVDLPFYKATEYSR